MATISICEHSIGETFNTYLIEEAGVYEFLPTGKMYSERAFIIKKIAEHDGKHYGLKCGKESTFADTQDTT